MAGQNVIIHDTRLEGDPPTRNNIVIQVNQHTPLSSLVQEIANASDRYGSEIRLKIMCHGFEDAHGRGGYGLQLCHENLNLASVNQLAPLNGKLSYYTYIYSCATADVAPGHEGIHGDGRMLCSRIASITGNGLFAADATQVYHHSSLVGMPIDFGAWEGNVLEFNAAGRMEPDPRPPAA
jgi:hypothetical protein